MNSSPANQGIPSTPSKEIGGRYEFSETNRVKSHARRAEGWRSHTICEGSPQASRRIDIRTMNGPVGIQHSQEMDVRVPSRAETRGVSENVEGTCAPNCFPSFFCRTKSGLQRGVANGTVSLAINAVISHRARSHRAKKTRHPSNFRTTGTLPRPSSPPSI